MLSLDLILAGRELHSKVNVVTIDFPFPVAMLLLGHRSRRILRICHSHVSTFLIGILGIDHEDIRHRFLTLISS